MTERERDERDLTMLELYEAGAAKTHLMRRFGVSKHYLYKLVREALGD